VLNVDGDISVGIQDQFFKIVIGSGQSIAFGSPSLFHGTVLFPSDHKSLETSPVIVKTLHKLLEYFGVFLLIDLGYIDDFFVVEIIDFIEI
jgi:hypothetical protein